MAAPIAKGNDGTLRDCPPEFRARILELEARLADDTYRVLVEEMHGGAITLDARGVILYSNRRFASMAGAPVEDVIGARLEDFIANEESQTFAALVDATELMGGGAGEFTLAAKNGASVPVYLSLSRIQGPGLPAMSAVVTDLREQRRNEAIVKEGQLSRLILEQAAEAIVVIDAEGKILRASDSARQIAGRNVLFQPFDAVFPLVRQGEALRAGKFCAVAKTGVSLRGVEAQLVRADGERSVLLVSAAPLLSAQDEMLGCVVTLTDISDRKRTEETLARQAEELARSNADLRQFAYSASHDLKEPLRHLAVYSELLQKKYQDQLDAQAQEFLKYTVDAAHRMESLVKDLLTYTRAADAPAGVAHEVDARAVLLKTLAMFEGVIAENGGSVTHRGLPVLFVHETHLQQLFQNLIGNAIKYRSEAAPVVEVWAEEEGAAWKLCVEDNGIGIHPQYQKHVFGLFKRLHGAAKYGGSGIGLAICQKIVQRYGGRIWVESELGKGSKFFCTLPGRRVA